MVDPEFTSDNPDEQTDAPAGTLSIDKRAASVGAILGGITTFAGTLSLQDVLQDNPFIAIAVFALLGAFVVFAFALAGPTARMWPKASFAIALLCTGVAAGAAAIIQGPMKVNLVVNALPNLSEAKPIKLGEYDVGWGSPTHMRAGGTLTLDLSNLQAYYSEKQNAARVGCIDMLTQLAPHVNIGPGKPSPATEERL